MNINELKNFCEQQFNDLEYEESWENMIYFMYDGTAIVNPFLDESGMFDVNPFEYYGDDFLNSAFMLILKED